MGVGKLGSMYGELTSISVIGCGQDLNPGPYVHQAQTLTTARLVARVIAQQSAIYPFKHWHFANLTSLNFFYIFESVTDTTCTINVMLLMKQEGHVYMPRIIMIANTTASIHNSQIEQHGHDLHKMYQDREISPFLTIHVLYLYYKCIAFDEAGGHA